MKKMKQVIERKRVRNSSSGAVGIQATAKLVEVEVPDVQPSTPTPAAAERLEREDHLQMQMLFERNGKLRAELVLVQERIKETLAEIHRVSAHVNAKYKILSGDRIDIASGEIVRAAKQAAQKEKKRS